MLTTDMTTMPAADHGRGVAVATTNTADECITVMAARKITIRERESLALGTPFRRFFVVDTSNRRRENGHDRPALRTAS
jgi:hypothetical protein